MLAADVPCRFDHLCGRWRTGNSLSSGRGPASCRTALAADYQFRHALYREVLYRRLSPAERMTFHRRLADRLERLRAPVEPETAAETALHFEEGHEYERAVHHLLLAAQTASRRHAHAEAVAVLEHARISGSGGARPPDALDLQILERLGNAFYALGDMAQSAAAYDAMATRAAAAGLLATQAESLRRAAHAAESIPFFERAVALDPELPPRYVSLSRIYSNLGEADRARQYAKLAYDRRDHAYQQRTAVSHLPVSLRSDWQSATRDRDP